MSIKKVIPFVSIDQTFPFTTVILDTIKTLSFAINLIGNLSCAILQYCTYIYDYIFLSPNCLTFISAPQLILVILAIVVYIIYFQKVAKPWSTRILYFPVFSSAFYSCV